MTTTPTAIADIWKDSHPQHDHLWITGEEQTWSVWTAGSTLAPPPAGVIAERRTTSRCVLCGLEVTSTTYEVSA